MSLSIDLCTVYHNNIKVCLALLLYDKGMLISLLTTNIFIQFLLTNRDYRSIENSNTFINFSSEEKCSYIEKNLNTLLDYNEKLNKTINIDLKKHWKLKQVNLFSGENPI